MLNSILCFVFYVYGSIMIAAKDTELRAGDYFIDNFEGETWSVTVFMVGYVAFIVFHVPFMFFTAKESWFLMTAEISEAQISHHVNKHLSVRSSVGDGQLVQMKNAPPNQSSHLSHYILVELAYTA